MKKYTMKVNDKTYPLIARNNNEAIRLAGTFGIKADYGVTSLIREDGKVVI